MGNIIRIPEELKHEFSMNSKGETSCSIRGVARILLVHHSQLSRHLSGEQTNSQLYKNLIEQGFEPGELQSWSKTGVPDIAIPTIAEYYAFDAKQVSQDTRDMARVFIRATSAVGIRHWFQTELGFEHGDTNDALLSKVSLIVQEKINPLMLKLEEQNKRLEVSSEERERLQQENSQLNAVSREMDRYPHFRKLLEEAMLQIDDDEYSEGIDCKSFIIKNLIPLEHGKWVTVSRRTAHYYLSTKGCKPERKGSLNIYRGKDVAFIKATIAIICQGL